jgi:hypothetical protein
LDFSICLRVVLVAGSCEHGKELCEIELLTADYEDYCSLGCNAIQSCSNTDHMCVCCFCFLQIDLVLCYVLCLDV